MLTPQYSAQLAADIYLIKKPNDQKIFFDLYKDDFDLKEDLPNKIKGKTGAFTLIKSAHAMGIATCGKDNFKGQAFVALKGTASGYDLLTDLNAGIKRFHTGGLYIKVFIIPLRASFPN